MHIPDFRDDYEGFDRAKGCGKILGVLEEFKMTDRPERDET